MKQCPRCYQTYNDASLNFCLDDGELLTSFASDPQQRPYADDSPPTLVINDARITNPLGSQTPAGQWQNQPLNIQRRPYGIPQYHRSSDQTIPTISLVLGILSVVMICCYGGIWLGLPAAILGFMGMRNADNDPTQYGGRGMAIGGMVLGVISLLTAVGIIFFAVIAR